MQIYDYFLNPIKKTYLCKSSALQSVTGEPQTVNRWTNQQLSIFNYQLSIWNSVTKDTVLSWLAALEAVSGL